MQSAEGRHEGPAPAGDVRRRRAALGCLAREGRRPLAKKTLAEPAYSEGTRHPVRVSIATPKAARGPSAAPRPVKRAAAGGSA
jgi:hypothetical protein